jgi:hypothetical protein
MDEIEEVDNIRSHKMNLKELNIGWTWNEAMDELMKLNNGWN